MHYYWTIIALLLDYRCTIIGLLLQSYLVVTAQRNKSILALDIVEPWRLLELQLRISRGANVERSDFLDISIVPFTPHRARNMS